MTSKENYVTINSNKIVSKLNDLFIGEDSKDILNINSKLLVRGVENTLLPKPNKNDKGKLVKLNNTGDDYDLVELKENNTRVHKICNMVPGEDTDTSAQLDFWTGIKPVDGDLILKKNEEVIYFINISGFQNLQNDTLLTWKLSYKIKGDTNYTDFTDSNRDSDGTFSHNFDSINDHQHRAFQIYYKADNDIIIDAFKVSVLTSGVYDNDNFPLAGAGGTAAFTAYGIKNTSYLTSSDYHTGHVISNLYDNYLRRAGTLVAISSSDTVSFAYDFSTPQIVTKYRMWPRAHSYDNDVQAPSSWELRAATTKTLYDAGTYTILDSHTGLGELDWDQTIVYNATATELSSDNLSKANEYNLATIGAYKYYVLHITSVVNISAGSGLGGLLSLGEFALYGNMDFLSINALILSDGNAISKYITEYPLAGAGGTESFTSYGLFNSGDGADTVVTTTGVVGGYYSTSTMSDKLHNNILGGNPDEVALRHDGVFPVAFAYEFSNPQIVTKYKLWQSDATSNKLPKTWELRGADKATYISNDITTYNILDSQSNVTTYTASSSSESASDNLNKANEYNLSTIGAYKYYVLHITDNNGEDYVVSIGEWALYTSYTLPSQIGNSGKQLITDGVNLGWGGPISNLNTTITADDKYKLVKLNEEGTLEYCSTDAIQLPSGNNLQRPLGIDGMIRYNNESDNMEVVENGSWKIVNTNNFNEASMGLINRAITDTSYDDEYNNSFGYYYHNRTLCPLYSEKLVYNVWHKLNFDKVFYDHSLNTNMINLLYNKIYVRETGEYLLTYSSAFKSTGGTDLNTKFKFRIYKNENSLVNSGDIHYESDEFQAIQTQINSTNHYFIPEFNHVLNLQQNDCISLYLYHNNNGSNSILLSYDYLGGKLRGLNYSRSNLYNYEYIKTIASKLCIKKILNN